MARQEGGQCSIAAMKHPFAWALGGFALFGFLRRRRDVASPSVAEGIDPRAEDLRRKLAEARSIVGDRDEFEAAEVPVDLAESVPDDPESRRREVHESARETVERMRRQAR
jgi:MYXO-CTERM domain-containing protein